MHVYAKNTASGRSRFARSSCAALTDAGLQMKSAYREYCAGQSGLSICLPCRM